MRISINVKTVNEPFGGANNFAKNLFKHLSKRGYYVTDRLENNLDIIIIVISHDALRLVSYSPEDAKAYKKAFPNVSVIHRINSCDEHRGYDNGTNKRVLEANQIADHTVFVSEFIRSFWYLKGINKDKNSYIIKTIADNKIFNRNNRSRWNKNEVLKIVTHHWSGNYMKGFDIYQRLDQMVKTIEWKKKIQFTFIGRTPLGYDFRNTNHIPPLVDKDIADELKKNHVYVTASRYEAAGNHYIEAMQCGLPVLHLNHGSLPEYCENFGVTFELNNFEEKLKEIMIKYDDIFEKLERINTNENKMIDAYCDLFAKINTCSDHSQKNRPYLFKFYMLRKMINRFKIRILYKILKKNN